MNLRLAGPGTKRGGWGSRARASAATAATTWGRCWHRRRIERFDGEPVSSEKSEVSWIVDLHGLDCDEQLTTLCELQVQQAGGNEFGQNPSPGRAGQRPSEHRTQLCGSEISG